MGFKGADTTSNPGQSRFVRRNNGHSMVKIWFVNNFCCGAQTDRRHPDRILIQGKQCPVSRLARATLGPSFYVNVKSVKAYYSDHFVLPLPPGHRFPMRKYRMLREAAERRVPDLELCEAPAASDGELALAHHPAYIRRVAEGTLSAEEQKAIGFPWSLPMAERARRSVGATIAACRAALEEGAAVNLAGGTHHAYADSGGGFCVFNDVAVAARLMQAERRVRRVAVIDLDVHQGNGTAAILARDDSIFTLSLHGERNYPFSKECSDLDVALPDGTGDEDYLRALDQALDELSRRFDAQLIIYLAGADPHEGDRLGRLKLSAAGMAARDERVFGFAARHGLPVALTMAGGYGRDLDCMVEIQARSVEAAAAHARAFARGRAATSA